MASANRRSDDELISEINVTPLVDIMLVLLVIFMVTASYIVNRSVPMNLPKAQSTEAIPEGGSKLLFSIDAQGGFFFNGKAIPFSDIAATIGSTMGDKRNAKVVISADRAAAHGQVMSLIDELRKQGISDFAIQVEAQQ